MDCFFPSSLETTSMMNIILDLGLLAGLIYSVIRIIKHTRELVVIFTTPATQTENTITLRRGKKMVRSSQLRQARKPKWMQPYRVLLALPETDDDEQDDD